MKSRRLPTDPKLDVTKQVATGIQSTYAVQDAIGRALQAHYVEIVREPIPERLLDLLAALEAGKLHEDPEQ